MKTKVFCVGFHKTGTSTLAKALEHLGYRVTGPNGVHDEQIASNVDALVNDLAERFDAFQDNPWPLVYQKMDRRYPGSKFILLLRDEASWLASLLKHSGQKETPMRRWIYGPGCPQGNEELYLERYRNHNLEVLAYFAERQQDLLVMDLTKGDGWEPLCRFLGVDVPVIDFPHANKAADREQRKERKQRLSRRLKRYWEKFRLLFR